MVPPPMYYVAGLGNGQAAGAQPPHAFTVASVLNALRQWWKVAMPIGLVLGAAGGIAVYMLFRPMYEASAWLRIEDTRPYIAFQSRGDSRRFVATQVELMRSPLVLGPVVSQPEVSALAAAEEEKEPIRWLAKEIKVSAVGQSELFKISFAAHDALGAAGVVNAVVNAYFDLHRTNEAEQTQRVIELLEVESQRRAADVTRLRDTIRALAEQASLKDPFAPKSDSKVVVSHPLGDLQVRLANAEFEREILIAQITAIKESIFGLGVKATTSSDGTATVALDGDGNDFSIKPTTDSAELEGVRIVLESRVANGDQAIVRFDPDMKTLVIDVDPLATTAGTVVEEICTEGTFQAALQNESDQPSDGSGLVCHVEVDITDATVERAVEQHPQVQKLKAVITEKQARRQELKSKLAKGEEDPIYQRFDAEIKQDEKQLTQLQDELRERARTELAPAVARERMEGLAEFQGRLDSTRLMVDLLKKRCDSQFEDVSESSGDMVEMDFMRTELARAEEVFNLIESRIVKLHTEQRAPARISRLQDAETPKKPLEMVPYKQIGLVWIAGLCFPFLLAVGWERIVRRVNDPSQLERDVHLPVVGEVARMPSGRNVFSKSASRRSKDGFGLFEESIDSLRTSLVLSEPLKDMKVLAVTSAANNEGKTSIAVQLAMSIARSSGETVLLVDSDMRSPDIHSLLGIPLGPGLADVLAHRCSTSEAIVTNWDRRVHLMPAGKLRGNPHRLLGNGSLKVILDDVKARYRYVIIDTPPVLAASEALVVSRSADASIICTMRDASRVDQVKKTRDRLQAAGARTVGIVLNGVPVTQYAYRYGKYYGYERR